MQRLSLGHGAWRGASIFVALLLLGWTPSSCGTDKLSLDDYSSVLDEVWAYTPELPKHVLDMAIHYQGDTSRLERAISKIIHGEPIKIATLGGSLSLRGWNKPDEAFLRQFHKWLEITFVPGCRAEAEKHVQESAKHDNAANKSSLGSQQQQQQQQQRRLLNTELAASDPAEGKVLDCGPATDALHSQASAYYRSMGHSCSGSHMEMFSLAVPAAGPGYAERCALQHVPDDVDLIVMDFGVNDYQVSDYVSHPERHAFERMLRTFLRMPHKPAILLFESYSWSQAAGTYTGGGRFGVNAAQDKHILIAEYYGVIQALGARAALFQQLQATGDEDNRLIYLGRDHQKQDLVHVSNYGHRWFADIMINYLQQVASTVVSKAMITQLRASKGKGTVPYLDTKLDEMPWAGQDVPAPEPRAASSDESEPASLHYATCQMHGNLGLEYPVYCSESGLKPPFFLDNEAEPAGICAIGTDFANVVERPYDGWEWIDEGEHGEHKWGFVSSTPGSTLMMKVDISQHITTRTHEEVDPHSDAGGAGLRTRSRAVTAWLIHVSSWHAVGKAELSCSGGCKCTTDTIDALSTNGVKATAPVLHEFTIHKLHGSLSAECIVSVKVLSDTASGSNKFSVVGITTSTNPVWHLSDIVRMGKFITTEDETAKGRRLLARGA